MEIDWNLVLSDENIGVFCADRKQAKQLLIQADKKGLKWRDGKSYLDDDKFKYSGIIYFLKTGTYSSCTELSFIQDFAIYTFNRILIKDVIIESSNKIKNKNSIYKKINV